MNWIAVAHRLVPAALVAATAVAVPAMAATGYLPDAALAADLGLTVPTPPDNKSEIGRLDLAMVETAQANDAARRDEAFHDAAAYDYDQLMARFGPAAGTDLSPVTSPILAHILRRAIDDAEAYSKLAKAIGDRARPYIEDGHIIPCETDLLRASDYKSYPSGHATNGYTAALVIADVMPARAQAVLARGIRYGDNRVVCGVHHPLDVEQGRLIAIAVVTRLRQVAAYRDDVACAAQEYDRSPAGTSPGAPFPGNCAALAARYRAEVKP